MAICRAAAASFSLPLYAYIRRLYNRDTNEKYNLPCPAFNVINGGKHGGN
jgi:enolase